MVQPHIDKLLRERYYLRDEEGNLLETEPTQMFDRVAAAIAAAEVKYELIDKWEPEFFALMADNKFLPNTPTLINAGKEKPGCFSACFTLPVEDSMEGIFTAVKNAAIIMKAGGGVGFNFSHLRAKGAIVKSTGHKSSGPVSFMKVFDAACDTISQGGVRRGAMIAILNVDHPDIEEFISCKNDGVSFSNFNISVGITDDFMDAVEKNQNWFGKPARELWNKIVGHAHKTGDPGLVFLDTINKAHPLDDIIEALNPCGELPLRPFESCNLGSINLMAYITDKGLQTQGMGMSQAYYFDWDALAKDIPTMVRFLDDVIDVNPFPLPEIDKASKESRKIGLGIMGWADCLIKMKIPYDSQEAIDLAEELMSFIYDRADKASKKLATEKGVYPLYKQTQALEFGRRNATLLTVAPTGTLSRLAGCSSGIEPIFAWETHHKLVDLEYDEVHWAYTEAINRYAPQGICEKLPAYMKTANEIAPLDHLKMQAAFQKHVDSSISKTINLPNDADVETVEKIYMWAWKNKLKGITVYRDGSKDNQPLNKIQNQEEAKKEEVKKLYALPFPPLNKENELLAKQFPESYGTSDNKPSLRKRGPVTVGVTHKVDTGRGKIYITINYSEYHAEPVEVFIRLGHLSTPTESALAEYVGRLISLLLKNNVPIDVIARQGNKVYSDTTFWYNRESFCSFPKLISHLLQFTFEEALDMAELDFDAFLENGNEYYEESEEVVTENTNSTIGEYCYNCSTYSVVNEGHCKVCTNCGESVCG